MSLSKAGFLHIGSTAGKGQIILCCACVERGKVFSVRHRVFSTTPHICSLHASAHPAPFQTKDPSVSLW